ncbi:hypothetical protein [Desulfosporosinus orientis]|uniref:hypothetical protein n=1 Tax=Desulfosporosinus orientis TaxID=1563 RepID=UPI0002D3869D|nr:hypothetical protein [Desulfosporosinus orientis]
MTNWIINYDYSFELINYIIKERGPEHIVLTTDSGQLGNEEVDGIKLFIQTLIKKGVSEADINVMLKETPAMLIGKI